MSLSYLGIFDDVVKRYPWGELKLNRVCIENQLIQSLIYGQSFVLNDGYLIANSDLYDSVLNLDTSLIGNLLNAGEMKIFSRGEPADILVGLLSQVNSLPTFSHVINSDRWCKIEPQLQVLQKNIAGHTVLWPKDKNLGQAFDHALKKNFSEYGQSLLGKARRRESFEKIFRRYEEKAGNNFITARWAWEESCWEHFTGNGINPNDLNIVHREGYDLVKEMMWLANDAYHTAYTCSLAWSVRSVEQNLSVRTYTAASNLYSDMFCQEVNAAYLKGIDQLLLSAHNLKFRKGTNFQFVQSFSSNQNLRDLRNQYLSMLHNYMNENCTFEEGIKIRDEYVSAIAKSISEYVTKDYVKGVITVVAGTFNPFEFVTGGIMSYVMDCIGNKIYNKYFRVAEARNMLLEAGIEAAQSSNGGLFAKKVGILNAEIEQTELDNFMQPIRAFNG